MPILAETFVWLLLLCGNQSCTGTASPSMQIVTQSQCQAAVKTYRAIEMSSGIRPRAICFGRDGTVLDSLEPEKK